MEEWKVLFKDIKKVLGNLVPAKHATKDFFYASSPSP